MLNFVSEIEWELKYRDAIAEHLAPIMHYVEATFGELVLNESQSYVDTYFDTDDLFLAKTGRTLRVQSKGANALKYNYKHAIETYDGILVRREIRCKATHFAIDALDPVHARLPLLAELCDALHLKNHSGELRQSATIHVQRRGYMPVAKQRDIEWPVYVLLDSVTCFAPVASEQPTRLFAELEIELCKLFPSAIERLVELRHLVERRCGLSPASESKYAYALTNEIGEET